MAQRHSHPLAKRRNHPLPILSSEASAQPELQLEHLLPSRIVQRQSPDATSTSDAAQTSCPGGDGSGKCEKPISTSTFTLPIVLGVVIPVVAAAVLFFILHRRHVRKQREEDANEAHRSLDFGMGDVPQPGYKKKRGIAGLSMSGEKHGRAQHQVSMDMAMSSPYLLPPELHESRESLHSLSRTINHEDDPYRPVGQLHDNASIRSHPKGFDGGSTYTSSSNAYSHTPSRFQEVTTADYSNGGNVNNNSFVPPPRSKSLRNPNPFASTPEFPAEEALVVPPYPVEPPQAHVQMPSISGNGLPATPIPSRGISLASHEGEFHSASSDAGLRNSNNYLGAFINSQDLDTAADKAVEREPSPPLNNRNSPPVGLPSNPRPARKESSSTVQMPRQSLTEEEDYGNGFKVTPPSPKLENAHAREHRYSMDVPPEEFAQAGLGAPGFDPRRLSMGFRPLPPDAVNEVDDPELRANRIRSFYKEYFDDSKPAPEGQYYEDYDENYLGDATYYDADQNNFVMPYAQPVTRRAMTPPPRGPPRFQGPPRGPHSSVGGMSLNGMGMGGGPGMGGGMGGMGMGPMRGVPGPRAYSSASGRGPRSYSSASGQMGAPRRPMPPPAALPTLPTPSKLRDDSFAIFNAADFAPPTTYRDRVAGRSESPLGERRPYSPAVPSHIPTASAFEELASMPSPHLLRKSGTFTGLDFAPPKRFRDPEVMSDAGSIRSNRSGVSAMQLGAIRNGAYRVSRLPQDTVGTMDDLSASLKPQWGMRQGS